MSDFIIYVEELVSHHNRNDGPFCPFPLGGYCDDCCSVDVCSDCDFAQKSYLEISK